MISYISSVWQIKKSICNLIIWGILSILGSGCSFQEQTTFSASWAAASDRKGVKTMNNVREPVVAGSFYPNNELKLRQMINGFLKNTKKAKVTTAELVGLIVPHAGYVYSGQVAAYAYNLVRDIQVEKIIIMGPSHQVAFQGASVYAGSKYRTPLGEAIVDQNIVNTLIRASKFITYQPRAHQYEHSVEVQIPFIQVVKPKARIIPIIIGTVSPDICRQIASVIADVARDGQTLIVASSDMSHYHSYEQAVKMDREVLEHIENFSIEGLSKLLATGEGELCGAGPVLTLMFVCQELNANNVSILKYANSGDVTGDKTQGVVGYSAVAFYKNLSHNPKKNKNQEGQLNQEERQELLNIARATIEAVVKGKKIPEFKVKSPKLKEHRGAFVTLHLNGRLRGCIGRFVAHEPLYQIVSKMAIAASTQDYRFRPVSPEELDDIEIEISVLSPLKKIDSIDQIKMGVHGIYIREGARSGCFLPQVAQETGWTKEQFLEHCCRDKAGLDKDAWKKGAEIYIFTAEVFGE